MSCFADMALRTSRRTSLRFTYVSEFSPQKQAAFGVIGRTDYANR